MGPTVGTRPAADFAGDDEGADGPFRRVVLRRDFGVFDEDEELVGKSHAALRENSLWLVGFVIELSERFQFVLKAEARADTLRPRHMGLRLVVMEVARCFIEIDDLLRPVLYRSVIRVFLGEVIQVPEQAPQYCGAGAPSNADARRDDSYSHHKSR